MRAVGITVALIFLAVMFILKEQTDVQKVGEPQMVTEHEIDMKTMAVDLSYYTREQYPKTYLALGERAVRGELQVLRRQAARKIASYAACDQVATSEYSQNRSTVDNIVVFADCESGFRIYFDKSGVIETKQY